MVALIFAISLGMRYSLWFTNFWVETILVVPLGLSYYLIPHFTGQGAKVWILSVVGYVYSSHILLKYRNNHRIGLGTHWTHSGNGPELKLHWSPGLHKPLLWLVDIFVLLELASVQSQCPIVAKEMVSPFPQSTITLGKGCMSLWGRLGEKLRV